jgi:hypothetical protein
MLNKKRERRKKVVESLLKRIRNIGLPDKTTGRLLRGLHFHLPIYLLLLLIHLPLNIASIIIIIGFLLIFAYVYYGGCVLTSIENQLFKNIESEKNVTIVDYIILFCKDELNSNTRNNYTIVGFAVWIITVMLIYLKRIQNKLILSKLKI